MLSALLYKQGIESVIIEGRSKEQVLGQVRAGLLEQGTVDLIRETGASEGLNKNGLVHEGVILSHNGYRYRVSLTELTGGSVVTIYGQQELTRDLIEHRLLTGATILFEAKAAKIEDLETEKPKMFFNHQGEDKL